MWNSFSQLAQGVRDQATEAVRDAGLDSQLVRAPGLPLPPELQQHTLGS